MSVRLDVHHIVVCVFVCVRVCSYGSHFLPAPSNPLSLSADGRQPDRVKRSTTSVLTYILADVIRFETPYTCHHEMKKLIVIHIEEVKNSQKICLTL